MKIVFIGWKRPDNPLAQIASFSLWGTNVIVPKSQLTRRKVSNEEIKEFAEIHNMDCFETSAKEMINVNEGFQEGARKVLSKINSGCINPYDEVS